MNIIIDNVLGKGCLIPLSMMFKLNLGSNVLCRWVLVIGIYRKFLHGRKIGGGGSHCRLVVVVSCCFQHSILFSYMMTSRLNGVESLDKYSELIN